MIVEELKRAFEEWTPYESMPSQELKSSLRKAFENPSDDLDAFFSNIVYDFDMESKEDDTFWLGQAIKYSQHAKDKTKSVDYLRYMASNYGKFRDIGGLYGSAASYLGMLSQYPDGYLAKLTELAPDTSDEAERESVRLLRCSAYGGYIMTATDFETGLEAGRAMKSSGRLPTLEQAEQFIEEWQQKRTVGVY